MKTQTLGRDVHRLHLLVCAAILALFSLHARAQQLSRDEVMARAMQFFNDPSTRQRRSVRKAGAQAQSTQLEVTPSSEVICPDSLAADPATGQPREAFYIVQPKEAEGGYVIVAADARMRPVLAYGYERPFVTDSMPEQVTAWLTAYAKYEPSGSIVPTSNPHVLSRLPLKAGGVPALVKTHWNQDDPYNRHCPQMSNGSRSVTGCVATAMAQVMKYHRWPVEGMGSKSYSHKNFGTISATFEGTRYDWDHMTDDYDLQYDWDKHEYFSECSEEEGEAVSTLMYHCGVAVSMDYGTSSGASTSYVAPALRNYFGYDADMMCYSVRYESKPMVSTVGYYKMLVNELNASRPVIYASASHCYIVDGYEVRDGVDVPYMHLNMGWGGTDDGYYLMSVQPESDGNSFRDHQFIVGIQPEDGICRPNFQNSYSLNPSYIFRKGGNMAIDKVNMYFYNSTSNPDFSSSDTPVRFQLVATGTQGDEHVLIDVTMTCSDYDYRKVDFSDFPVGEYLLEWRSQMQGQEDFSLMAGRESTVYIYDKQPELTAEFAEEPPAVIEAGDFSLSIDVTNCGTEDYFGPLELHLSWPDCAAEMTTNAGVYIAGGSTQRITFSGTMNSLGEDAATITLHESYTGEAINDGQGNVFGYTAECHPLRSTALFWELFVSQRYGKYFVNARKGYSGRQDFQGDVAPALLNADGNVVKVLCIGKGEMKANTNYTWYYGSSQFDCEWTDFPADVPDGEYFLRLVSRFTNSKLWMAPVADEASHPNLSLRCVVEGTQVTIYDGNGGSTVLTREPWTGSPLWHDIAVSVEGHGKVILNYDSLGAGKYVRTVSHGEDSFFQLLPEEGYRCRLWIDGCETESLGERMTLGNVSSSLSLRVVFERNWGDANGDGKVTIADLAATVDALRNGTATVRVSAVDINGNGWLDAEDADLIAELLANGGDRQAALAASGVPMHEGHFYVDLGLEAFPDLRWAQENLGSESVSDYGFHYAWGETSPKQVYNSTTYHNATDDAPSAVWGGKWRTPSPEEWEAVLNECTLKYVGASNKENKYGVDGCLVTGPNGNSIFLPEADPRFDTNGIMFLPLSLYWSNEISADNASLSRCFSFGLFFFNATMSTQSRSVGGLIRPVFSE